MVDLSAVILAAGMGVRMGPRGRLMPKGLLKIDQLPLVARSVQMLRAQGVRHVRIVTGHLNDQYEALFGTAAEVTLLHNPAYDHTGSLLSLLTGLDGLAGPVVVLESDVIFEAAALAPVQPEQTRIVVSGPTHATDEVYIWARAGANGAAVFDFMSKLVEARAAPHIGELVGITCFCARDMLRLRAVGQELQAQNSKSDYEDAVIALAREVDIEVALIKDLAWSEIDNETMLARATDVVWPKIKQRDGID